MNSEALDKDDRVGLLNQAAEARLPVLASHNVVAVEEGREAGNFEPSHQFVGERGRIPPRIGDEDLELLPCAAIFAFLPRRWSTAAFVLPPRSNHPTGEALTRSYGDLTVLAGIKR